MESKKERKKKNNEKEVSTVSIVWTVTKTAIDGWNGEIMTGGEKI